MLKTAPEHVNELEFHPAANIFPMMTAKDLEELATDIELNGQREPCVLIDGKVIDGRNRFRACQMRGIEPDLADLSEPPEDLVKYVVSMNLHRRHLTTSQRAMIAAKLATRTKGGDRKSKRIKGSIGPLKISDAANLMNVGSKSVKRAKEVLRTGDQETIARVEAGKLPVSNAATSAQQLTVDGQASGTDTDCRQTVKVAGRARRPGKKTESTTRAGDFGSCVFGLNSHLDDYFRRVDNSVPGDLDDKSPPNAAILARLVASPAWDHTLDEDILQSIDDAIRRLQTLRACISTAPAQQKNQHVETSSPPPATAIPLLTTDLFRIERRDNKYHVIMPNGDTSGPFNAKHSAQEQANKYRQQAQVDPAFLESFECEAGA